MLSYLLKSAFRAKKHKPGLVLSTLGQTWLLNMTRLKKYYLSFDGITPFDQDKLKNELPCLEELLANQADLQEIKKNLTGSGISLFGLPRFSELELQGYATMPAEDSLALFIFEQGSSQAQRNDSLLQCLKSIAVGQVNSKRVFNRCKKEK